MSASRSIYLLGTHDTNGVWLKCVSTCDKSNNNSKNAETLKNSRSHIQNSKCLYNRVDSYALCLFCSDRYPRHKMVSPLNKRPWPFILWRYNYICASRICQVCSACLHALFLCVIYQLILCVEFAYYFCRIHEKFIFKKLRNDIPSFTGMSEIWAAAGHIFAVHYIAWNITLATFSRQS